MTTSLKTMISVCLYFERRFTTGSLAGLANGAAMGIERPDGPRLMGGNPRFTCLLWQLDDLAVRDIDLAFSLPDSDD